MRHPPGVVLGDPLSEIPYEIGFTYGGALTMGGLFAAWNILSGLELLFGRRGTQLLIQYHDKLRGTENDDAP